MICPIGLSPSGLPDCGKIFLVVQVHHVDSHVPKSQDAEVHKNNQQLPRLKWLRWIWIGNVNVNYYSLSWVHDTLGHQGRDAAYRKAHG